MDPAGPERHPIKDPSPGPSPRGIRFEPEPERLRRSGTATSIVKRYRVVICGAPSDSTTPPSSPRALTTPRCTGPTPRRPERVPEGRLRRRSTPRRSSCSETFCSTQGVRRVEPKVCRREPHDLEPPLHDHLRDPVGPEAGHATFDEIAGPGHEVVRAHGEVVSSSPDQKWQNTARRPWNSNSSRPEIGKLTPTPICRARFSKG